MHVMHRFAQLIFFGRGSDLEEPAGVRVHPNFILLSSNTKFGVCES
jgi:hypothetical protein